MVWGCPTPRKTAWAGKWGRPWNFHGHPGFRDFQGADEKKNTRIFYAKKNGFPSTSRLDVFITDVCWAREGGNAICSPEWCPAFQSEGVLISTGSFRFLCAPKLRWWRHHLLQGGLDPCLIWPKSIATSADFLRSLSWQFEVGESSCPSKKWRFWNWLVNCG